MPQPDLRSEASGHLGDTSRRYGDISRRYTFSGEASDDLGDIYISEIYLGDISRRYISQVKLQAMSVVNEKEVAESQRNLADVHAQLAALQARCWCRQGLLIHE